MADFKSGAKNMLVGERENELDSLLGKAGVGTSITVNNKAVGGFSGSTSGTAYEFRKTGENKWSEIFGDHDDVTDAQLRRMYLNSRGFKKQSGT